MRTRLARPKPYERREGSAPAVAVRAVIADRRCGRGRAVALAREVPEQRELNRVALAAVAAHEQQRHHRAEGVALAIAVPVEQGHQSGRRLLLAAEVPE